MENTLKTIGVVVITGALAGSMILGDAAKEEIISVKHYYKASWEWLCEEARASEEERCYWQAPGGNSVGAVDLRSVPQMSQLGGTPEGFGVFAYDREQTIEGAEYLGTDETVVADFVWTKLTTEADPTGLTAVKPLRGKLGGEVALYIAGEKIKSEPFTEEHRQRTVAVFQADYERNINAYPRETVQKWVGATMKEVYGELSDEKAEELVPVRFHDEEKLWLPPETVIGDTFTNTNDVDLASHTATGPNGGFSWTEVTTSDNMKIFSNAIRPVTSGTNDDRDYRAESNLSTDDMYAFATIGTTGSSFDGAVDARFSASARTHYQSEWGNTFYRISRFVAGSHTIMQQNTSYSNSAGDVMEIRVDGSTVQAFKNGSQVGTNVTDTNITGHLRAGLNTWHGQTTWDTFEAGDLVENTVTSAPIQPLSATGGTVCGTFNTGAGVTTREVYLEKYAGLLRNWTIGVEGGALIFEVEGSLIGGDEGNWSAGSLSTNTWYDFCITYDFDGNDADNPIMCIDQVSETVTEDNAPSSAIADSTWNVLYVRQNLSGTATSSDALGEIAIYTSELTGNALLNACGTGVRRIPLQNSNIVYYWPGDSDGTTQYGMTATTTTITNLEAQSLPLSYP